MKIEEQMKMYVNEIILLSPTDEEMYQFVLSLEKHDLVKDVVTWSDKEYHGSQWPRVHDTTGVKPGGRLHIDYGFSIDGFSCHLTLDEKSAPEFIYFIKELKRSKGMLDAV
jgi:hypothetical protein